MKIKTTRKIKLADGMNIPKGRVMEVEQSNITVGGMEHDVIVMFGGRKRVLLKHEYIKVVS